jgi:hypothetical protein
MRDRIGARSHPSINHAERNRKMTTRRTSWLTAALLAVAAAANAEAPPQTQALLRQTFAALTSADAFRFHAEILVDRVDDTGQKLQFAAAMDVAVRRPDRLRAEYTGDLVAKRAWYDGKLLTVFDPDHDVYASMPGAGDVAATLAAAEERYGVDLPLADLARSDLWTLVESGVERVRRLGLHDVDGTDCHHLALRRDHHDVQVWIKPGERPLLCKLLFTYTEEPGSPQFMAIFSDWDFDPKLRDAYFEPELPDDAVKAEFLAREDPR